MVLVHSAHCPKNYLNFRMKTEPITVGAEATVFRICLVSGPSVYVTGSVLKRLFRKILGQGRDEIFGVLL